MTSRPAGMAPPSLGLLYLVALAAVACGEGAASESPVDAEPDSQHAADASQESPENPDCPAGATSHGICLPVAPRFED